MKHKILIAAIIILSIILFLLKFRPSQKFPFPSMTPSFSQSNSNTQNSPLTPPPFPAQLPNNFSISVFAKNLDSPRDLEFTPLGTLLTSIPNQGKVIAVQANKTTEILKNLNKPHGLAFYNGKLFVAELTSVKRYSWDEITLTGALEKELFKLPYDGGHNTRSIVFNKKGKLFISLGSSCNVCIEENNYLASILVSDQDGSNPHVFAKGLRNSVFLSMNPKTQELWAPDMGRDNVGDDLPPEEINIIRENNNYGWPICYSQKIHDTNFDPSTSSGNNCDQTTAPIFTFQAHSAPLGLTFINSPQFPDNWQGDLLVAYHGSWNRSIPTGYKIVHMKVSDNSIISAEDFLTGFVPQDTKNGPASAYGRPVDVIFDKEGNFFISDDKAGMIYKVTHTKQTSFFLSN